jgi:hypothetical protein
VSTRTSWGPNCDGHVHKTCVSWLSPSPVAAPASRPPHLTDGESPRSSAALDRELGAEHARDDDLALFFLHLDSVLSVPWVLKSRENSVTKSLAVHTRVRGRLTCGLTVPVAYSASGQDNWKRRLGHRVLWGERRARAVRSFFLRMSGSNVRNNTHIVSRRVRQVERAGLTPVR